MRNGICLGLGICSIKRLLIVYLKPVKFRILKSLNIPKNTSYTVVECTRL